MNENFVKKNWKRIVIGILLLALILSVFAIAREVMYTIYYCDAYDFAMEWKDYYLFSAEAYSYIFRHLAYFPMENKEVENLYMEMIDYVEEADIHSFLKVNEKAKIMISKIYEKYPETSQLLRIKESLEIMQRKMDDAINFYEEFRKRAITAENNKFLDVNIYCNFLESWVGRNIYAPVMRKLCTTFKMWSVEHKLLVHPKYYLLPQYLEE